MSNVLSFPDLLPKPHWWKYRETDMQRQGYCPPSTPTPEYMMPECASCEDRVQCYKDDGMPDFIEPGCYSPIDDSYAIEEEERAERQAEADFMATRID